MKGGNRDECVRQTRAARLPAAKRFATFLACLAGGAYGADDAPHQLVLKDGTVLHGRISRATPGDLTFVSPLFAQPLVLDPATLSEVKTASASGAAKEPFLVSLADGTAVAGNLAALRDDRLTVRNGTFDDFVVPLAEVLSVQRITDDTIPTAAITAPNPRASGHTKENDDGENHRINLPERCDITLNLRTRPKPQGRVTLTGANGAKVTVEVKGGDIILQGRVFFLLKNLDAVDDAVKLHLYWNQRTGRSALFTSKGVCLGETNHGPVGAVAGGSSPGVRIDNTVPNFSITFLGLNSWDGLMPRTNEGDAPSVLLTDATSIQGSVTGADGTLITLRDASGATKQVPLAQVFRIRFASERSVASSTEPVSAWFADGTHLDGKLVRIADGAGVFESRLTGGEMKFAMSALHQMVFRHNPHEKEFARGGETFTSGDVTLHGSVSEGAGVLHWKLDGARSAVPISIGVGHSITRPVTGASPGAAVFYLTSGEMWSGELTGMSRTAVEAAWDFGAPFTLLADHVRAIQFPPDRVNIAGFKESGWLPDDKKSGAVTMVATEASIIGSGSICHPQAMRARDISFKWQQVDSSYDLCMRLFCNGPIAESGTLVRMDCYQNKVRVLSDGGEGGNRVIGDTLVDMSQPLAVRMQIEEDQLALWVGNSKRFLIPIPRHRRNGSGLIIEGNAPRRLIVIPGGANGRALAKLDDANPVRVWDFSAQTSPSQASPGGGIPAAAMAETLCIPRFRKEAPPRHVIVAANRDLLRGEIEAVTAGHVIFRTGLETLRIPLNRLAAIISPMDHGGAIPTDRSVTPNANDRPFTFVTLNSGGEIGVRFEAIRDGVLVGTHPLIGACRIPLTNVTGISSHKRFIAPPALDAWRWESAPEPVLPEAGGSGSPLLGKEAPAFKLPLLGGGEFDLAHERDKVIVLDFWATWCGPCVKSLPAMIETASAFPAARVRLISVNQGEGGEVVRRFLEARKLNVIVAMDAAQNVARQFGVDGIPHTVIIGPDGKIVWVQSGHSADSAEAAAAAIKKLLAPK